MKRRGLTQVEAVTLVAIVLVVLALVLPAIQRVRSRAARMSCTNHLRDLGVATLRFHDAYGRLPQGGDSGPDGGPARTTHRSEWSWAYHLLPHLGQESLHRETPDVIDTTPLAIFYCPERRSPVPGPARLDYAGNAGTQLDGYDGTILQGTVPKIGLSDIVDGVAHTVLISERRMNQHLLERCGTDRHPYNRAGWNTEAQVFRLARQPPERDWSDDNDLPSLAFGSGHRAGINVVFADGSVRHIAFQIDAALWARACVRHDRTPPNDP